MSKYRKEVREMERLLGRPPREVAKELHDIHGLTAAEISEKFDIDVALIEHWISRKIPVEREAILMPDGEPVAEYMRRVGIKTIGYDTVRARIRSGWGAMEAIYTAKGWSRKRRAA